MWIDDVLSSLDRRYVDITFDPHVFDRREYWKLDLTKIEDTVRKGKVQEDKCEEPNKLCLTHYYGKENITYVVLVRYHTYFIEVKTAWPKKGK